MTLRRPVVVVALVAVVLAGASAVDIADGQDARPGKVLRIGRLSPLSANADVPNLDAFRKGLRDLGWVEHRNFVIETRFADGNAERLPALAAELVRGRVDLILSGSTPGALAAKRATSEIPIVMVTTGDPVGGGLVASLARPGRNLTGVTALGHGLNAKRLELLKESIPGVSRVAVLANPESPYTPPFLRDRDRIARMLAIELPVLEASAASRLEQAFTAMGRDRAEALMVLTDLMFINHRQRLVELAATARLPAVYPDREFVEVGGLMFYGASLAEMYGRAADYAYKILNGAKPADLPIQQPTRLELVINLRTAKALGVAIPRSVLVRADRLVE